MNNLPDLKPLLASALILFTASMTGGIFTETSFKTMLSLAFALWFYLITPGYFILLNFNLTSLERIIFGMPVSITILPLMLYVLDIIGVALSRRTVIVVILLISIIAVFTRQKCNPPQPAKSTPVQSS